MARSGKGHYWFVVPALVVLEPLRASPKGVVTSTSKPSAGNSQILNYGGDSGDESWYRKGTLHLYHNTIVSTRSGNTTLMRLATNNEHADVRSNVVFPTAGGSYLAITSGRGMTELRNNWLPSGWVDTHESSLEGQVDDLGNVTGAEPGFVAAVQDLHLAAGSSCLDAAGDLADGASAHPVSQQYLEHQDAAPRPEAADIGAFER